MAHVATTTAVAIIVKSGIAVDFADFAIAIPLSPTKVNRIHRKCVPAVTALAKTAARFDSLRRWSYLSGHGFVA
jgi:hypothetical protein